MAAFASSLDRARAHVTHSAGARNSATSQRVRDARAFCPGFETNDEGEQDHRIWGTPEPSTSESISTSWEEKGQVHKILKEVDVQSYSENSHPNSKSNSSKTSGGKTPSSENECPDASRNGEDGYHDASEGLKRSPKFGWSAGAVLHEEGKCKPCRFMTTRAGCQNFADCNFCHLYHEKVSRPWKSKRQQCRQLADRLDNGVKCDVERIVRVAGTLSAKGNYMRNVVKGKLRSSNVDQGVLNESDDRTRNLQTLGRKLSL